MVKLINNIIKGKFKQLSRFATVGVANTIIDFLIFTICTRILRMNYIVSQALGYSFGIVNSFMFNKKWTFHSSNNRKKIFHEIVQFAIINLSTLIITLIVINILVKIFIMNVYEAKIIVTLIAQVTNFLAYKLWIFI